MSHNPSEKGKKKEAVRIFELKATTNFKISKFFRLKFSLFCYKFESLYLYPKNDGFNRFQRENLKRNERVCYEGLERGR